jgi:acetate kinase
MVRVSRWLRAHHDRDQLVAVGHRVVHRGPSLAAPVVVDDEVLAELERLVPLSRCTRHTVQPMVQARLPGTLQVACFARELAALAGALNLRPRVWRGR